MCPDLPFWVPFFVPIQGVKKRPFPEGLLPATLGRRATTVQAKKWCLTSAQQGDQEPRHHPDSAVRLTGSRFVRGGFVVWSLPGNCHFGMICCEIFRLIIKWDPFLGGQIIFCKCMVIVSDVSFNQEQNFCKMELKQNKMNKHR